MPRFLISVSTLALAALPRPGYAQEPIALEPLTFYGSLTDLPLSRTGASVEVLDAEALRDAPAATIEETLSTVPGVSFTNTGGQGGNSFVRLRGLPQYYAPVLFNGIEITDPSSIQTQFDWGNILGDGLTRVEVVKGAQSTLYGADAAAGIIAVQGAEAPREPGREGAVALEVGAYNTRRGTLSYGMATETAGAALSYSSVKTDGFSAIDGDGYDDDDGLDAEQLSFDLYYDAAAGLRLGLTGFAYDAEGAFDSTEFQSAPPFGTIPRPEAETETRSRGIRAYADFNAGGIDWLLELSRYDIERESTDYSGTSDFEARRDTLSYGGTTTVGGGTTLSFGLERVVESAEASDDVATVGAIYGEAIYAATPDLDLALALRHEDHSEYGGFTSARGAVTWRIRPDLTLRGTLANGYRAPSLFELFDPTFGNDALDPEISRTADLGLEKTFANGGAVSATLFYAEIDDLVTFDTALPPFGRYAQGDGTTTSEGVDLAGSYPVGARLTLSGAFTYTDVRDADDVPLRNVPRYALSLGVAADITERLSGSLSIQRMADFEPVSNATFTAVEDVDDFTLVNARLGFDVTDRAEMYLKVENLLDEDYERVPGYNTADRAAYFGIRASF